MTWLLYTSTHSSCGYLHKIQPINMLPTHKEKKQNTLPTYLQKTLIELRESWKLGRGACIETKKGFRGSGIDNVGRLWSMYNIYLNILGTYVKFSKN